MKAAIVTMILLTISNAYAKDFGKYGNNYVIAEPDLIQEIQRKLHAHQESGALSEFNKNFRKEIESQIKNPHRVIGITNATEDTSRSFDPSTKLEEDIMLPDGSGGYKLMHKAGTRINPLDYMLFNEPLIFIDGEIDAQLDFANEYYDKNNLAKIILINGKPGLKTINNKEYYHYFDQWGAYSSKFNIAAVPSVVYQKNSDDKFLTIDEINLEDDSDKEQLKVSPEVNQ